MPGGEFCSVMNDPNGETFEHAGVFLEVKPRRRLVTTDAFRPGWIPSGRAFMVAETLFEDAGAAPHPDRSTSAYALPYTPTPPLPSTSNPPRMLGKPQVLSWSGEILLQEKGDIRADGFGRQPVRALGIEQHGSYLSEQP